MTAWFRTVGDPRLDRLNTAVLYADLTPLGLTGATTGTFTTWLDRDGLARGFARIGMPPRLVVEPGGGIRVRLEADDRALWVTGVDGMRRIHYRVRVSQSVSGEGLSLMIVDAAGAAGWKGDNHVVA